MIIAGIHAAEILDSRGVPTVEVTLELPYSFESGVTLAHSIRASVPSGKSTGKHEALERRDGDRARYDGKGVLDAVAAVNDEIAPAVAGKPMQSQAELDQLLIELDGTTNKRRLGANAMLGVSIAAARAFATVQQAGLYASLGGADATLLPVPCFNVINGGAHADNPLEFQEFMLVPAGFASYADALRAGAETYHALATVLEDRGLSTAVGDEGGFAPAIAHPAEALDLIMHAISRAGYRPGEQIFVALDPAASAFYGNGRYTFGGRAHDAADMIRLYEEWIASYPILSIEDGFAEDDFDGWVAVTRSLGDRVQLVGDDIFVSDQARVRHAIENKLANAVLLKPNQIGTVTEITETARVARDGGFRMMMSHRSGETDDPFVADLAVALGTGQIKAGAPARGERVAKYNQLLRIERALGDRARYAGIAAFTHSAAKSAS